MYGERKTLGLLSQTEGKKKTIAKFFFLFFLHFLFLREKNLMRD